MRMRIPRLLSPLWKSQIDTIAFSRRNLSTKDFVILDPRQARVLPSRRRQPVKRETRLNGEPDNHLLEEISELDAELWEDAKNTETPTVTNSLDAQRPSTNVLSPQMYENTLDSIRRGFSKLQLRQYLEDKKVHVARTQNKAQLAHAIVSRVWAVRPEEFTSADSALVENVIELDEKVFLLLIAHGGRALREWSKSGAAISLFSGRRQIMVRSTPQTFQWILAKLSNFESKIKSYKIDLRNYSDVVNLAPNDLRLMQRLTDSYFSSVTADGFLVWTTSRKDAMLVSRLLLWLLPSSKWKPCQYYYDNDEVNITNCRFRQFSDTDALDWTQRNGDWARFEVLKQRTQMQLRPSKLAPLEAPTFASSQNHAVDSEPLPLNEQLRSLVDDFNAKEVAESKAKGGSLTLMVTLGYLLHKTENTVLLPNAGMKKSFCTNIPYVEQLAGTLPHFNRDVIQESPLDSFGAPGSTVDPPDVANAGSSPVDSWDLLLRNEKHEPVFTTKRGEVEDTNLRLAQIKLVPSPHKKGVSGENFVREYPPIEVWCPFANDKSLSVDDARVVMVEKESSKFVSLPQEVADLRVTMAHTTTLPLTQPVSTFLEKARFDPHMPNGAFVPASVEVEAAPGVPVEYLCQSVTLVTQAELEFDGHLFQLSQTEGGKLGGRQIEGSLVYHTEDVDNFNIDDAKATLANAIETLSALKKA